MKPVVRSLLAGRDVTALQGWASEIEAWPAGSHVWGHYAERTVRGDAICRTENVSACHRGVAALVDGPLQVLAAELLGEPAAPFKDKLNYKQPGGAGFKPHQDVLAYPGVTRVMSILVAIDACTLESGCLWLAESTAEPLATDDRGVVLDESAAGLAWSPAELGPGDVVSIDGLAPHYSDANRSDRARRVLVATYAPSRLGYRRDTYYASREAAMEAASARDGLSRISTLADFEGTQVTPTVTAHSTCTHV